MSNLFALAASQFLAVVCLVSALAKTIQHPATVRMHPDRLFALSHARWFALIEVGLGVLLLAPAPAVLQALAAIVLAVVVIDEQMQHVRHPEQQRDEFGSVTPHNALAYSAIGTLVLAATLLLIAAAARAPGEAIGFNRWITMSTLLSLLVITRKLGYDAARGLGYPQHAAAQATRALPADLFIGADARAGVTAADLVGGGRAALILGLAPRSPACRDVYALLAKHALLLSEELQVVAVASNDTLFRATPGVPIRTLVDPACHLSRYLGIRAHPYAVLVNHDLSLLAAPSQTSPKAQRLITLLVTTAQNAPKSFISFDLPHAST